MLFVLRKVAIIFCFSFETERTSSNYCFLANYKKQMYILFYTKKQLGQRQPPVLHLFSNHTSAFYHCRVKGTFVVCMLKHQGNGNEYASKHQVKVANGELLKRSLLTLMRLVFACKNASGYSLLKVFLNLALTIIF